VRTTLSGVALFAALLLTGSRSLSAAPAERDARVAPRVQALLSELRAENGASRAPAHPVVEIPVPRAELTLDTMVDLILEGDVDAADLNGLGAFVQTSTGGITTLHAPLRLVEAMLDVPGLRSIDLPNAVELQADISVPAINTPAIWGGPPPTYSASGQTGAGVIIGIVDTGIDVNHADLKTSSNSTRILSLWDQGINTQPPPGYTYGTAFTSAQINAGLYIGTDLDGHGTHITGVAAGNGRATGNGLPAYRYVGVAPEADLVVVKLAAVNSVYTDARIIDGVNFVFSKAASLGKPAVVLLALGKITGPHDGSDPLDVAISSLTGPGRLVVTAAGNYKGLKRHAEWTSTGANQTGNLTVTVGSYTPSPIAADNLQSEAWYDANASYQVSVVTPNGTVVGPVARGATLTTQTSQGLVVINNGQYTSSNGSYRVNLNVFRGSTTAPQIATGTWTYRFLSGTSGTRKVDAWITNYQLGAAKPVFVSGMTETNIITSPGTANNVLTVGAFSTKRSWVDIRGTTRTYFYAVLNEIADFSSCGPRRDGAQLPHVSAPGYGVGAALSSHSLPSDTYILQDGVHRMNNGTSVAAAHVAGGVALMLEKNPNLTPTEVRNQLQSAATTDAWTGAVPNVEWGYGKLHLESMATSAVDDLDPVAQRFRLAALPNPSRGPAHFQFTLEPRDIAGARSLVVRIVDVSGREVAIVRGTPVAGTQELTWDGTRSDGQPAVPGMYLARLEVGDLRAVRKFVRVQ
jgi:subtilisin family serine protease